MIHHRQKQLSYLHYRSLQQSINHHLTDQVSMCSVFLLKGILGCIGGMFLHLVLGSVYQWGIINVYVTSYYHIISNPQSLTTNAIVFPIMMLSIGFTMKLGNYVASKIGTPIMTLILTVIMSGLVFASSYTTVFIGFVMLYGVLFGLFGGMLFTSTLVENNKYFVDKQVYVNGFILIGTGLGSAIFGIFSYNFLNPQKLSPINGLYIDPTLKQIAMKVPQCMRYLSLFYLCLGITGSLLMLPVYFHNKSKDSESNQESLHQNTTVIQLNLPQNSEYHVNSNAEKNQSIPETNNKNELDNAIITEEVFKHQPTAPVQIVECPDMKTAICNKVTYFMGIVLFFTIIGNLFVNNNYKTYVKSTLSNDQFLTLIGAFGSVGNGVSRFFFNLLFRKIGVKFMVTLLAVVNIIIYTTIKLTMANQGIYCFMIIVCNMMLGATLAMAPTQSLKTFGQYVGADIYGLYWTCFALANMTAYGLATSIDLNILFYVFAGTSAVSGIIVWFVGFDVNWNERVAKIEEIEIHSVPIQRRSK